MAILDRLNSAAGSSSHRVKARFGVKCDYTGLKRIGMNPLELIGIPLGDDIPLRFAAGMIMDIIGQMINSHTEVAG